MSTSHTTPLAVAILDHLNIDKTRVTSLKVESSPMDGEFITITLYDESVQGCIKTARYKVTPS